MLVVVRRLSVASRCFHRARPGPHHLLTPTVTQRGVLTVRAAVVPHSASCIVALRGPRRQQFHLPSRSNPLTGDLHGVTACRLPAVPARGSPPPYAGRSATKRFVVGLEPAHAQVSVVADGFTQSNYSGSSPTLISYGVELENPTLGVAALNVTASVSFTDTLGRSVATDATTITAIPGRSTFYLGGLASSNVSLTVASMQVTITVGSGVREKLTLPIVSGVTMSPGGVRRRSVSGADHQPLHRSDVPVREHLRRLLRPARQHSGRRIEETGASIERTARSTSATSVANDINPDFIPAGSVATIQGRLIRAAACRPVLARCFQAGELTDRRASHTALASRWASGARWTVAASKGTWSSPARDAERATSSDWRSS